VDLQRFGGLTSAPERTLDHVPGTGDHTLVEAVVAPPPCQ